MYNYKTKDFTEISFFLTKGNDVSVKDIEVANTGKKNSAVVTFEFESEKIDLSKLKESFQMGHELVEPKFFVFKQKEAKNLIFTKINEASRN
jgi:hypothetical protein